MTEVSYKQGMTTAWSDGEKVVIKNPTGITHVKDNVEQIFGMGEFDELNDVQYMSEMKNGRFYEMVTGYIPERVKKDIKIKEILARAEKKSGKSKNT